MRAGIPSGGGRGCFGQAAAPDERHLGCLCKPAASLHPFDLCVGVAGAVAVRLIVYSKGKNAKKYRKGEEYGSARWGTAKDIAPYIDSNFENNILLTQTERLTMTGRPKDPRPPGTKMCW